MAQTRSTLLCSIAVILLMCITASYCDDAPSCPTVVTELTPCISYLKGGKEDPSAACCGGVKSMAGQAKTKPDRQVVCECIKKALGSVKYDASLIPTLPKKCSVSIDFPPIDQTTDCSKDVNSGMLA